MHPGDAGGNPPSGKYAVADGVVMVEGVHNFEVWLGIGELFDAATLEAEQSEFDTGHVEQKAASTRHFDGREVSLLDFFTQGAFAQGHGGG